jgi:hypothetical protein
MQSWLIPLLGLLCTAALGTGHAAPAVMDLQPRGVDGHCCTAATAKNRPPRKPRPYGIRRDLPRRNRHGFCGGEALASTGNARRDAKTVPVAAAGRASRPGAVFHRGSIPGPSWGPD